MRPEQIKLDILEYTDNTMPYHQMSGTPATGLVALGTDLIYANAN